MTTKTLTASRLAEMVRWLTATNAMLCALPAIHVPAHLHGAWIDARAHTGIIVSDLLRLSCTDIAVEQPETARIIQFVPANPRPV